MRNAAQDLRESRGPSWRRPGDEGTAAGGRDGSYSEESPFRVRQAFVVPSLTEQPPATGHRAEHGRAVGRHPQQQEQLKTG